MQVIALVATPFDPTQSVMVQGPPWPGGQKEWAEGGLNDFQVLGAEVAVYLSDRGYQSQAADTPTRTWFPPRLNPAFSYEVRLFAGDEPSGASRQGVGDIAIMNSRDDVASGGDLSYLLDYGWDGRSIRLYRGEKSAAFSTFTQVFAGTVDKIELSDKELRLRLRDLQAAFSRRIQDSLFGGTGGREGGTDLAGRPRPLAYGRCFNIAPPQISASLLVYQFGTGRSQSVEAVRDKGGALTAGADYISYEALIAATVAPSAYATCLAESMFRLGAAPEGLVTCDVKGDATGGYVETTADIASRIAMTRLGQDNFPTADILGVADLNTAQPAPVGLYIDGDNVTAADALDRLMAGIGGYWYATRLGKLQLGRLAAPAGPAEHTLTLRNVDAEGWLRGFALASYARRVGYQRLERIQTADELAPPPTVSEANRQFYGNQYRWAVAQDPSRRTKHKFARQVDTQGLFAIEADAKTEAQRLQDLHGPERGTLRFGVLVTDPFAIEPGDVVAPSFGPFSGEFFVVIGMTMDLALERHTLELWG